MKPNPWRQVCPTPPTNQALRNWIGFDPNNEPATRPAPGYGSALPSRSTVRKMTLAQVKLLPIETRAALADRDYKDGRRILLGVVAITVLLGLAWLVLAFSAESTAVRLDVIEGAQR
jgi:hypothetical protein